MGRIRGNKMKNIQKFNSVEKLELGGIEQYCIIRAEDVSKPVMLFLHGGPGVPEYFIMKEENKQLQKYFIMVYWEQRGAGKSYCRDKSNCNLTTKQLIEDTKELSEILINRFNKEKIYIMGHSWGSMLGLLTVQKYPELFYAYLGIGQVSNQYEAEKESLQWIKHRADELNDKKGLKKIQTLTLPEPLADVKEWDYYLRVHRKYLLKYGGTYHQKVSMLKFLKDFLFVSEYTLKDKIMLIPSAFYSLKCLWHDVVSINLYQEISSIDVPVYIFQGVHDYQVSYALAKKFFDNLKAPKKQFLTFENSAHSPITEEYHSFNEKVIFISENA